MRKFYLTDGELIVYLDQSGSHGGMAPPRRGLSDLSFNPYLHENKESGIDAELFTEHWNLVTRGLSHDEISYRIQILIQLLRNAWLYHKAERHIRPVYLGQQAAGETNPRYALVLGSSELSSPNPLFDYGFEREKMIVNLGLTISRFVWRDGIPGTLPSPTVQQGVVGPQPNTLTMGHIANFYDNVQLTHIYVYDDPGGWSANFNDVAAWNIWPAPAAAGDICYVGSTNRPFKHLVFNLGTAGIFDATYIYEYWDGGAWTELVLGDDITTYPVADIWRDVLGTAVLNIKPPDDWVKTVINTVNAYWIRIRLVTVTLWNTTPANATYEVWEVRRPHTLLLAEHQGGDVPSYHLMRYYSPTGGEGDPKWSNTSRIIVGMRSEPGFDSHLNACGLGIPPGWTTSYGTDTTAAGFQNYAPHARRAYCDFAIDSTLVMRVTYTGEDILTNWTGEFRMFLRVQQNSGDLGDVSVQVKTFIHLTGAYGTYRESALVELRGVDQGIEAVEMYPNGVIQIPFHEMVSADDLTNADLYFEVHASRVSGSAATLEIFDLILIPVDEWANDLIDPISEINYGNSALRGSCLLDVDGGVLKERIIKSIMDENHLYPAEPWAGGGERPKLAPVKQARFYYLLLHYPEGGSWGDAPMISTLGMWLGIEQYSHHCYLYLRGDD